MAPAPIVPLGSFEARKKLSTGPELVFHYKTIGPPVATVPLSLFMDFSTKGHEMTGSERTFVLDKTVQKASLLELLNWLGTFPQVEEVPWMTFKGSKRRFVELCRAAHALGLEAYVESLTDELYGAEFGKPDAQSPYLIPSWDDLNLIEHSGLRTNHRLFVLLSEQIAVLLRKRQLERESEYMCQLKAKYLKIWAGFERVKKAEKAAKALAEEEDDNRRRAFLAQRLEPNSKSKEEGVCQHLRSQADVEVIMSGMDNQDTSD